MEQPRITSQQTSDVYKALVIFLEKVASVVGTSVESVVVTKQSLFNRTSPFNNPFSTDLLSTGILSVKSNREQLLEIMNQNGVKIQGNFPNETVVFPENFQESIPEIVAKFLEYLASKPSKDPISTKTKQTKAPSITCSHGFKCDDRRSLCCARGGGGGAAAAVPSSSKSSVTMTFADFKKSNGGKPEDVLLKKFVKICNFGNKCNLKKCPFFHPVNTNMGIVQVQAKTSKDGSISFAVASVCHYFPQCLISETCKYAHLCEAELVRATAEKERKSSERRKEGGGEEEK